MWNRWTRAMLVSVFLFGLVLFLRIRVRRALDSYFRGDTLTTPDLRGMQHEAARRHLLGSLRLEVARRTYDPKVPKGTIISQQPGPGIRVRKGKTIFLRISKGADLQRIPDLRGKDLRKASIALRNEGFQVGAICMLRDRSAATNHVLNQSPRGGSFLGLGGRVNLLVASNGESQRGHLPRVTGLTGETARLLLKGIGIRRIHLLEKIDEAQTSGTVIQQAPPGGTFFEADTLLKLWVAVPPGSRPRKLLDLGYHIPPGLSERKLVVILSGEGGRRVVHSARHLPGEHISFEVAGRGEVHVSYYLDDFLVAEETY
jgi:beta-lactam-binding protein with PASTA domain